MWLRTLGRRQPGQTVLSFVSSGGREFEIRDLNDVQVLRGGNATVSARISVNDGKWHQLGVTWQVDGRVRLYTDCRLVQKTSLAAGPAIPAVGSLILGQSTSVTYASIYFEKRALLLPLTAQQRRMPKSSSLSAAWRQCRSCARQMLRIASVLPLSCKGFRVGARAEGGPLITRGRSKGFLMR